MSDIHYTEGMRSALLFGFSDIGRNTRLISFARGLLDACYDHVYLVGFLGRDVPLEFERNPKVSMRYVFPFWRVPSFVSPILFPLKLLYFVLQILAIAVAIPSIDLVLVSCSSIYIDVISGYIRY
jgi:hypothetical protein